MNDDSYTAEHRRRIDDYLAEREYRRKRAWRIGLTVMALVAVIGSIGGWRYHVAAQEHEQEQRQQELVDLMQYCMRRGSADPLNDALIGRCS